MACGDYFYSDITASGYLQIQQHFSLSLISPSACLGMIIHSKHIYSDPASVHTNFVTRINYLQNSRKKLIK